MMIASASDVGNLREINQDRVAYKKISADELLCVLCDGMGGHKAGEVAAQMAVDYCMEHFCDHEPFETDTDIKIWFTNLLHDVNEQVNAKGESNEAYNGMGTTIVICYFKGDYLYTTHVGDSRAYTFKQKQLHQLTVDDTLVNALLRNGFITEKQAIDHPQKNVLIQAVGVTDLLKVSFDKTPIDFKSLMICSDGLYNSLNDSQIIAVLSEDCSVQDKCDQLIELSKKYGGYDNISVILWEGGKSHE